MRMTHVDILVDISGEGQKYRLKYRLKYRCDGTGLNEVAGILAGGPSFCKINHDASIQQIVFVALLLEVMQFNWLSKLYLFAKLQL